MLKGRFRLDNRVPQNSQIDLVFLMFEAGEFPGKTKKRDDQYKSGLESRSKCLSTLIFIKLDLHLTDSGICS